jgi:Sigma-70, region 4
MSRLDELPPDQRAALSLLLRQRKSYAEVAAMLGISAGAVHDRAHAALAVLAPAQARGLTPEQREEIGDYLLGQQPGVAERLKTRTYLSGSDSGRAWAQATAGELSALGGELPEIPPAGPAGPAAVAEQPVTVDQLSSVPASSDSEEKHARPSSRLGGALILAGIAAAVIVVVILVSSGGGSGGGTSSASSSTSASKTTTGPTQNAHFVLHSPNPKSRTLGAVEILSEGAKHAFYIEAQHVPASNGFFYALWLYNSHKSSEPLSKSPPVGKSHRLAGGSLLPTNAGDFHEMLLTRETNSHPTHPGHVVLRGPFTLAN